MSQLFSNKAGEQLLDALRQIFSERRIYYRKHRFIVFVCGGPLEKGQSSLRKRFVKWAGKNLPDFICLMAEDALRDSFAGEGRDFVNLALFETVVADVADCVLIFPESAGSFAEAGFFANSRVRKKTLIANPLRFQTVDSFLNLGPIDSINRTSYLKPTILIPGSKAVDFGPIRDRLKDRVKWPEHRQRISYSKFGQLNFRDKLLVVFETLRLLRLATLSTLRHVLQVCFGGAPRTSDIAHLLRILLAAKFIVRDGEYFRPIRDLELVEIEKLDVEQVFARVQFFYQRHSDELFRALPKVSL